MSTSFSNPFNKIILVKFKIGLCLIILLFLSSSMHGQIQSDTLYLTDGSRLIVSITEVSDNLIKFSYPNETIINIIATNKLRKICFYSGRYQEFNSIKPYEAVENVSSRLNKDLILPVKSPLDWHKVQVAYNKEEVSGLNFISNIRPLSKIREIDKLKMGCAMYGGNVLLLNPGTFGGYAYSTTLVDEQLLNEILTKQKVFHCSDKYSLKGGISNYTITANSGIAKIENTFQKDGVLWVKAFLSQAFDDEFVVAQVEKNYIILTQLTGMINSFVLIVDQHPLQKSKK